MTDSAPNMTNGAGAAAVLAAGVGCSALGLFALAGDALPWAHRAFDVWTPSGPLSGVSLGAVAVWLVAWVGLALRWSKRNVSLAAVNGLAFAMLAGGLLLTFPPFMDLVQGK
jgi:hypothetical protein